VGTRGLESVLISNPGGGDDGAIWGSVRVTSTGNSSGVLGVDLFNLAALIDFDSVACFEAETRNVV
jgi:hypothetical protein